LNGISAKDSSVTVVVVRLVSGKVNLAEEALLMVLEFPDHDDKAFAMAILEGSCHYLSYNFFIVRFAFCM